jgi:O-antigen ligase
VIRKLKRLEKYIVILLLFLLPTQFAYHFWPDWVFVFGIRVDLLSPSIYLTDILVFVLVLLNLGIFKKFKKYFLAILIFALVNTYFSFSIPISIYKWFKIFEYVFLTYYFSQQQILKTPSVVKAIFYSLITFSLIGILQFIKRGTIGGILYYLGERSFNQSTPGIALVSLGGADYLRSYSTFSHPNSLAGYLGAALLFILLSGKLKRNIFNFLGVLIILICFVLSFSLSAYLGVFVAFSYFLFSKSKKYFGRIVNLSFLVFIVCSLVLPILSPWISSLFPGAGQNISQRLDLAFISGQVIGDRFLIGSGLGTFILNMPIFKGIFAYSWLLQPVHNIFLLVFAEMGILGLFMFIYLLIKTSNALIKNKRLCLLIPLMFILFTGLFDHYTLTLQQNTLLFSVLVGISFHDNRL